MAYFIREERYLRRCQFINKNKCILLSNFDDVSIYNDMKQAEVLFVLNQCINAKISKYIIDTKFNTSDLDPYILVEYLICNDMDVTLIINEFNTSISRFLPILKGTKANLCWICKMKEASDKQSIVGKLSILKALGLSKKTKIILLYNGLNHENFDELITIFNNFNIELMSNVYENIGTAVHSIRKSINDISDLEVMYESFKPLDIICVNLKGTVCCVNKNTHHKIGNIKKESILKILNKWSNL